MNGLHIHGQMLARGQMLEFSKITYLSDDLSDASAQIKSMFATSVDGTTLITTRIIENKGYRLVSHLDGSVGMLGTKVNAMCAMDNSLFKELSLIQFAKECDSDI